MGKQKAALKSREGTCSIPGSRSANLSQADSNSALVNHVIEVKRGGIERKPIFL